MFDAERAKINLELSDVLDAVRSQYTGVKSRRVGKDRLQEYILEKEDLEQRIGNFNYSIEQLNQKKNNLTQDTIDTILSKGIDRKILIKNLRAALKINTEFDVRFFKTGLKKACDDPNTITLLPGAGKGSSSNVIVRINLDETAGSINDWANAVKKVRQSFGDGKKSGVSAKGQLKLEVAYENAMADWMWQEKFYKPAREGKRISRRKFNKKEGKYESVDITAIQVKKYWDTMRKRLEASGKFAPYWQIIDKGVAAMRGSGTAYPVAQPTNFTGTTIKEIKEEFQKMVTKKIRLISKEIKQLKVDKEPLIDRYNEVKMAIKNHREIASDMASIKVTPELAFYARVTGASRRKNREYSDKKLRRVLEALRAGDITGLSITAEGRIELTSPGRPRFRVSISRIISEFGL